MKINFVVCAIFAFLLAGCESEKKDYSWYMQHPLELKQEIGACMSHAGRDKDAVDCEVMMRAGVDMTALVNQQQEDPEKFGQGVLNAQTALAKLDVGTEDYNKQLEQIKVYLAVVALSSPE